MLRHLNMHPVSFNSNVDLSLFMFMGRFAQLCLMIRCVLFAGLRDGDVIGGIIWLIVSLLLLD